MRALRAGLGALTIIAVVLAGVYVVMTKRAGEKDGTRVEPTTFVSDFSFPDRTGTPVRFENVDAELRVITFWASWSPYSKTELPALAKLKDEYGRKIEIVAINRDANPNDGRAFFDSLELKDALVEVYDTEDTYYKTVGGYNMPETVFVNGGGGVLKHVHGPMTYDEMRATIEYLLNQ